MSNIAPVSGVGKGAKRVDRGMAQRVQRNARLDKATGGNYGARTAIAETANAAPMPITASAESAQPAPRMASLPNVDIFAPGSQGTPLSDGAPGGPGRDSSILRTPVASPDNGSALARALLLANPENAQLAMIVEAFNEEGK
jgi:hypothetical protein